jgi:hypothetical protein
MKRVALEARKGLIYVANPEKLKAPVGGFPKEDVFAFNDGVFEALSVEWATKAGTSSELWGRLNRFVP